MKVAKLVYTSFVTRVEVEGNLSDEEIGEIAMNKLIDELNSNEVDTLTAIDSIEDDTECPAVEDEKQHTLDFLENNYL